MVYLFSFPCIQIVDILRIVFQFSFPELGYLVKHTLTTSPQAAHYFSVSFFFLLSIDEMCFRYLSMALGRSHIVHRNRVGITSAR